MKEITILYYSSNREKSDFEQYIQGEIAKQAYKLNIPIISVTQKPVDFGRNICVGDVGLSDWNIYRQMQIACREAKTKYICTTEADCLYPPTGYFDFQPPENWTAGHYTNVYILWKDSHIFNQKAFSLCGLYANREFLLSRFQRAISDKRMWWPEHKPRHPLFYKWHDWTPFKSDIPIINCKTGDGMRIKSGVNTEGRPIKELSYWGTAVELEKRLWGEKK